MLLDMQNGSPKALGMVTTEFEAFNKIEQACGNRYMAIMLLAKAARNLGNKFHSACICESKLIQWILTGSCPYSKSKLETRKIISETIDDIEDQLEFVDDEIVRQEVIKQYKQSIKNKRLTLCNNTDISEGKTARINILLRMIWYHFKED